MPPVINPEKCTRCGLCSHICPMDVFRHEAKCLPEVAFGEECWHCNACVLDCPAKAIELRLPLNYMMLNIDAANLHRQENKHA